MYTTYLCLCQSSLCNEKNNSKCGCIPISHSLNIQRKGKEAPDVQMGESCDIGIIGVTRDLERTEMVGVICEEHPLVLCSKEKEDFQCEMMDLPVAECLSSQIEFSIFNHTLKSMFRHVAETPPSVLNSLVDCTKFVEGLEIHYDASTTHIPHFESFSAVVVYKKGQGGVEGLEKGGGFTLVNTIHLEHPPDNVFMFVNLQASKILILAISHQR